MNNPIELLIINPEIDLPPDIYPIGVLQILVEAEGMPFAVSALSYCTK